MIEICNLPSGFPDAANFTYNVKATYNHFMVLSVQSYSHQAEATCGNDSLKDLKIYRKGFHLTCADVKLSCLMFAFKVYMWYKLH